MTIINTAYLIPIIIVYILIMIYFLKRAKSYKKWIEDFWSLKQTKRKIISRWLYLLSIFLFMLSLLDFRGPEEVVKGNIPDQRTIIAIDSSLSMLAEDVRPNRFLKSIQIARHFVKNSPGHQFSIVLFSDIQKRILPFTDDVDLIDSRLAALEKVSSIGGGSNITQAIQETINYFDSGSSEEPEGNLMIFTDGEESDDSFDLNIPKKINIALLGIGTAKGSNIPLRYEDGSFRGYKETKGQQVVTKLEEGLLKEIATKVSNSKLIIANSYSLPTEELKTFFRNQFKKRHGNSDMRIRPVKSHFILIPAIVFYIISVMFQFGKTNVAMSLILFIFFSMPVRSEEEKNKIDPKIQESLNKIKSGKAEKNEILKTAEMLLKNNKDKESLELYEEYSKNNKDFEVEFNKITAKLKNKKIESAIDDYQAFLNSKAPADLKEKLRSNMLLTFSENQEKNQDKNKEKKKDKNKDQQDKNQSGNEDQKDNKDQQESKDQKENKNQDNKDNNQKNEQNKKPGENKDSQKNESDKNKEKDQEKDKKKESEGKENESEKENQDGKEDKKPKSLEEKEKQEELRRKMLKIPGMIKQIMNDDRELQKRLMDTSTKEKKDSKPKRDW